jgi:hypothetical protein
MMSCRQNKVIFFHFMISILRKRGIIQDERGTGQYVPDKQHDCDGAPRQSSPRCPIRIHPSLSHYYIQVAMHEQSCLAAIWIISGNTELLFKHIYYKYALFL